MDIYRETLLTEQRRSLRRAQQVARIQPRSPFDANPRLVVDMSPEAIAARVDAIAAALSGALPVRVAAPVDAGRQLREARARTGLSQAAAAQRIGLSRSALAVAEQGRWNVSGARLAQLLTALEA